MRLCVFSKAASDASLSDVTLLPPPLSLFLSLSALDSLSDCQLIRWRGLDSFGARARPPPPLLPTGGTIEE